MLIQLRHSRSGSTSVATIGGVIEVTDAADHVICYGMTAGHIVPQPFSLRLIADGKIDHDSAQCSIYSEFFFGIVAYECVRQCDSEDGR